MRCPVGLLGVPIDNVSLDEAVDRALALIAGYSSDPQPHYIATVNVDFYANIFHSDGSVQSAHLLEVLRRSDLVTADGMPLLWLSRLLGSPLKTRLTGAALVPVLVQACAKRGYSVFLLGGEPSVTERAAATLKAASPNLRVAGVATPRIDLASGNTASDEEILQQLDQAKPDLLLIGLGCPKQELWFHRVRSRLHVPLSMGVGGTFKFIAGATKRAPESMQTLGMEWLYRWTQEPRILTKRYLRDLYMFPRLALPGVFQALTASANTDAINRLSVTEQEATSYIKLPVHLTRNTCDQVLEAAETARQSDELILDFSATQSLDAAGSGLLLELSRRQEGRPLQSRGISKGLQKALRTHFIWDLITEIP